MFEPFTTISALAVFALVSPGLGIALSFANFVFGLLSLCHVWAPVTHHVQATAHVAQFI